MLRTERGELGIGLGGFRFSGNQRHNSLDIVNKLIIRVGVLSNVLAEQVHDDILHRPNTGKQLPIIHLDSFGSGLGNRTLGGRWCDVTAASLFAGAAA